jgi:GntR family transcriptional regulator/MocR family aminotransferase
LRQIKAQARRGVYGCTRVAENADAADLEPGRALMLVPLKLVHDKPLQQQLYDQLRQLIVAGQLTPGSRMPSTRMLSDQFAVSRITVVLVYERLVAEGYLRTHPASGTFVAESASCQTAPFDAPDAEKPVEAAAAARSDIAVSRPDPQLFPVGRWRAFMRRALDQYPAHLGAEFPGGVPSLRRAIAEWLAATRALTVSPDQVVVVGSRLRALDLAAHLALRPGQRVVIEAPSNETAAAYAALAARLVRVPVDAEGIRTDRLPSGAVAIAHLTPARQRPLGVALSPRRRGQLMEWAAQVGATIVEEDCDGDFRYESAPVPPLMSLPGHDRVIHLGGFAATLGPGVSLAYLVLPERLCAAAVAARPLIDDRAGWLEETALAGFIDSGCYARHVYRLRKIYAGRRNALLDALRLHFGEARIDGSQAGLEVAWFLPHGLGSAATLAAAACRCGIRARALPHSAGMRRELIDRVVLLDYAAASERGIREAIAQLAAAAGTRRPAVAATGD